jgi:spore coat protein U-like protein
MFNRRLSGIAIAITLTSSVLFNVPQDGYAGSTSASNQATATVAATCTISAQNLSFGNLVLPVSAQSASTSMSVLCSKNHPYTVGLAYGGVYGQGGVTSGDYWTTGGGAGGCSRSACNYEITYTEYNSSGTQINSVNYTWAGGATPTPPNTTYNSVNGEYVSNTTVGYAYGKMIGVSSGDSVAYSIAVPNNPGQIWNAGESSYSSTGTGAAQTIPVVGTLVPSQSGSYPTPDTYMDTVTATVNF